MFVDRCVMDIE